MSYWTRYKLLLPFFILMRLSTYPLAPLALRFFSSDDKRTLKFPFRWLQTDDHDLSGDEKHQRNTVQGDDPLKFKYRLIWLWRNGGHHAAYHLFGCPRPSDYPQHRSFTPLLGRYLELYLGWSSDEPRGKFVLTMRWRDRNY